jgi:hypothetical protein
MLESLAVENGATMKKARKTVSHARNRTSEAFRKSYDFRGGVRGKYASRFANGASLVLLAPDVAKEFPTARAVNRALRSILKDRAK